MALAFNAMTSRFAAPPPSLRQVTAQGVLRHTKAPHELKLASSKLRSFLILNGKESFLDHGYLSEVGSVGPIPLPANLCTIMTPPESLANYLIDLEFAERSGVNSNLR